MFQTNIFPNPQPLSKSPENMSFEDVMFFLKAKEDEKRVFDEKKATLSPKATFYKTYLEEYNRKISEINNQIKSINDRKTVLEAKKAEEAAKAAQKAQDNKELNEVIKSIAEPKQTAISRQTPTDTSQQPAKPQTQNKTVWIIAGVVFVVIIVLGIVFIKRKAK